MNRETGSIKIKIERREIGYIPVIKFSGTLSMETLTQVRKLMVILLEEHVKDFIFDFSNADYLCSGIISLINNFLTNLKQKGGRLFFLSPSPSVQRELEMMGLGDEKVKTFETETQVEDFIVLDDSVLNMELPAISRSIIQ